MTRETKANLLFLAIFLALIIPGGVMLFKKKLDPAAPKMFMPDAVKTTVAYMVPWDGQAKRVVPPQTQQWVNTLAQARTSTDVLIRVESGKAEPLVSSDHLIQLIGRKRIAGKERWSLLIWSDAGVRQEDLKINVSANKTLHAGQITQIERVDLPSAVRSELASFGYTKPPAQVICVTFETIPIDATPIAIRIDRTDENQKTAISVINFT